MKNFFLLLALLLSGHLFAQTSVLQGVNANMINEETTNEEEMIDDDDQDDSTLESDTILIDPEAWDTNFDNLLNSWYIKNYTNKLNHTGYKEITPLNDAVIIERLSKLPNIIEMTYNNTVRNSIISYTERHRNLVETMLGLESIYFPMIEETLDKYGLPIELKYLVIIESALNPTAFSKAGATGLWQFMMPTGKDYGLEINSLIDERRDPIKSTDAACRFLKDLYNTYGDWHLALAAYNCGGRNVNKAIKRANGKRDYWTIYPYLPKETRSYVPYFIAVNYVMNYYANHNLYPALSPLPFLTDTVMVTQSIHFDQIAEVLQIDKEMIRTLNPQYKRDIIPGYYKPQILKLPTAQIYAFVEKENKIANYRVDEFFANRSFVMNSGTTDSNSRTTAGGSRSSTGHTEKITHRVTSGESVLTIAYKYGVTASNILRWNNLRSNKVAVGKILTLYVDNGGYPINSSESRTTTTRSTASTSASSHNNRTAYSLANSVQYKVKTGDTFYSIAQKYPGYSYTDLMKLNNTNNPNLKAGQYILVPKN